MINSLLTEYNSMKKRYKKLVLEGKQLQKKHEHDVKYFINNEISDKEWQGYLEKNACNIAIASIRIKKPKNKIIYLGT